jgi:uncharacterized protein YacL
MTYDLHPRLKRFFEPAHPREVAFGFLGRDLARIFFEFLRNLVVVGGIRYFSIKTNSTILAVLFIFSIVMLVLFLYSFIVQWDLRIFRQIRDTPAWGIADFTLGLFVSLALTFFSLAIINNAVTDIANVQAH